MTSYITDKFDKFVADTVDRMHTNDDLYDVCTLLVECNKTADNKLEQMINDLAYAEIAYKFRVKKLKHCDIAHGSLYEAYLHPTEDARNQLLGTRDKLMDYCQENGISYEKCLQ
jgi:hypothetical protein